MYQINAALKVAIVPTFVISADCVNTSFSVDNWQQKVLDSAVFNRVGISSINTPLMLSQI